jgi:hypothetical protein
MCTAQWKKQLRDVQQEFKLMDFREKFAKFVLYYKVVTVENISANCDCSLLLL